MDIRAKVREVSNNLKAFTGSEKDEQLLVDSVYALNDVYRELTNPFKAFKDLFKYGGNDKIRVRLREFKNYSSEHKYIKTVICVGRLCFELQHHNHGDLYIVNTNASINFKGLSYSSYKMDYTVRNSGDCLHSGDVKEYLSALATKFEEIVTPLIDAYIEEVTQDSILHNDVTLHNYNHDVSNFPMTVKVYSECRPVSGLDFETICSNLNIPLGRHDGWYVLEIATIDDFCSFLKEFGSENVDMNILNYLNKSDGKDFYLVKDSFLAWNEILILKNDSFYDSGEDENYEFLLRNPENLMNEVYSHLNIDIRELEFKDYDGQYYYFCTENTGEILYPIGQVFKLQQFLSQYNLPYKVDEEFMESIFKNEGQKWVNTIPLILDGSQINSYIREKILNFFEVN